ncbi:MAG: PAS domain S-box protein [Bacteroidales bacterium]|nr:PAS domain S-box protein [Bacteroidales bacterium]
MNNYFEKNKQELVDELIALKKKYVSLKDRYEGKITTREHDYNKLKENYNLIRTAGAKAKLGGWNVILEENRSYWSDEVAAIHEMPAGYSPLVEEGINFYAPEWRGKIKEAYTRCATDGIPYDEEMEIITAKGKRIWVRTIGEAIRDNTGKIYKVQGAFQDISGQKSTEQLLKQSEARYKAIFESTGTTSLIVNQDTTILMANRECLKMTGYTPEELIGKKWTGFVAPESLEEMLKNHRLRRKDPDSVPSRYEVSLIDRKGNKRHAVLNISMIPESALSIVSILDITKRILAENDLRKAKSNLEEYFENDISADYVASAKGEIFSCNSTFLKLFGFEKKSAVETFDITGLFKNPDDRHKMLNLIKRNLKVENQEVDLVTTSGKTINTLINAIGIFDESGNLEKVRGYIVDITRLKDAEKQLRLFRTLIEGSNDAIEILDPDTGKFLDVNERGIQDLGYTREEFLGLSVFDIDPGVDQEVFTNNVEKLSKVENIIWESIHKRKDGSTYPVEVNIKIIQLDRAYMIAVVRDITERKLIESELLKLSRAVEQSPASILITDLDGTIEYVNPKILEITGYSKDELIGENPRIFNSGNRAKNDYKELWSTISSGKKWSGEFQNKKKNGELYWESAHISPILNNKMEITNYVAVKEDITDRKKMEKIQEVLVNISDAVVSTQNLKVFSRLIFTEITKIINTKNFFIALYNEQTKMFSTIFIFDSLDESITDFPAGKTLSSYIIRKKKSCLIDKKTFNKLLENGEIELVGLPSEVWIGVPLWENEKVIGVIVIQTYEGEKPLTEEDLKILEYAAPSISLAIERKKFIEDLKIAKKKAEESDSLKSAFLSNMSHEIRTPMNGILGFTSLLSDPDLSSAEREDYIDIVKKSGQRMLNTVSDIIEISKIEAGAIKINVTEVDVVASMKDLVQFFKPEAEKKALMLDLEIALPESAGIINTDINKFDSILTNLIKNAIKYTNAGRIIAGCRAKGDLLEFYVQDTGIGIPANRTKAIFERFIQADISDKRAFEGSGLGLTISKSYVEILGGNIWVVSEEGKGSTFYFTILNRKIPGELRTTQKKIPPQKGSAKQYSDNPVLKILIAEDDAVSEFFISKVIKPLSKEILIARNGEEAIDIYRNNKDIDLVLMDLKMPGTNGYEASRQIRKLHKEVIIIAQSAFALSSEREKAIEAGCNDFIAKPFKKDELIEMIVKHLKRK